MYKKKVSKLYKEKLYRYSCLHTKCQGIKFSFKNDESFVVEKIIEICIEKCEFLIEIFNILVR